MVPGRRADSASAKAAELSPATPTTPTPPAVKPTAAAVTAVAKLHGLVHRAASPPDDDPQTLLKSFRRKKQLRARLLPLPGDDTVASPASTPRKFRPFVGTRPPVVPVPISVETQSLLAPLDKRTEDEDETATLARVHALVSSPDEIDQWIATYETEKTQFASFALFTELKLDEIHDKHVAIAGRPNAVEAAACCATLFKMPGIVGCYKTLLEKLAVGVLSVVYAPDNDSELVGRNDERPLAALVRECFGRKPFFQRLREVEMQLREARSLTDPKVLASLTIDDVADMALVIPVRVLCDGIVQAYGKHLPHLDHLLACVHEKKLQLQLEFYQDNGRRRRLLKRASTAGGHDQNNDDDEDDEDDPAYPMTIPLTSSAQICRAITQHAATFSSSGKEMILCSILEHIDVESFKDVFKRFDAHGKTCFLHHLSVLESSDHLQLILEDLPNPGDTLFRFYYVICGGGGSGRLDEAPKHVFFQKVLGAEMEFFFLCDLAAYLNDEQWTLLSQEYEKHAQARKARRKRLRRRLATGDAEGEGEEEEGDEAEDENDDNDEESPKKPAPAGSSGSIEQFQTMIWNYVHHHKFTSPQIWQLMQAVLMPSLEETEAVACLEVCMDHLALVQRWKRLVALVEEIEADTTSDDALSSADHDAVRSSRLTMLKKLLAMLSRDDRLVWIEKAAVKNGLTIAKPPPPSARKESTAPQVTAIQAPPKPVNLEDPKPYVVQMRLDTKMLWLETLLNAVANDKETSARTAMLKQSLLPFLNGKQPPPPSQAQDTIETLADAEKAIHAVLLQLRHKHPTEEAALWRSILPEHLKPKTVARSDRAVSPMLEISPPKLPTPPKPEPVAPPSVARSWWEAAGPDSDVATAFRTLLETKSEAEVLAILRHGQVPAPAVPTPEEEVPEIRTHSAAAHLAAIKRKMSAVLAVAEPMEWQEFVKVGMLDQGTQTDVVEVPVVDSTSEKRAAIVPRAPLTLTTLLGRAPNDAKPDAKTTGKRKNDKFQKLNNTAVPRSVAGLITSWRVNTDQLAQFAKKSMPTVLRLIADAYGELLTAGRRKAVGMAVSTTTRGAGKDLTLAQIVYQQFLHSYGLPGIADMHLLALSCALEAYRSQHLRVEFFSRFVFEEASKLELSNYLEFLECLVCDDVTAASATAATTAPVPAPGPVTTKRQRFVPRIMVSDKENWLVPLDKAQEAAQLCFRAMRKTAVTAFCDRLAVLAAQGPGAYGVGGAMVAPASTPAIALVDASVTVSPTATPTPPSDGLVLNVDFLLKLVVDEWRDEQLRREAHLLNVFRAGDVNGDGELTSAEFSQIVLAIDHTRDVGEILLMYSETLRRTQSDAIDAETFLQIAKENELDRAAWNEDGDLRNVVNDLNDLEATWRETRPFFLGTLEALVRDLPTLHFLRVCEGAGCGCLKCILDGYVGFQRMRRELATSSNSRTVGPVRSTTVVSEALVWARFWHLMRQLYEAASESPGVLTAWEGADYMRIDAAPRPPPRFFKYRRVALPNFLFPDTTRISGKVSLRLETVPEAMNRDAIEVQFQQLLELMTYTSGSKTTESTTA